MQPLKILTEINLLVCQMKKKGRLQSNIIWDDPIFIKLDVMYHPFTKISEPQVC